VTDMQLRKCSQSGLKGTYRGCRQIIDDGYSIVIVVIGMPMT
jgi:hypothetical protein